MMSKKISLQDMPILDLDLSKTKRFEASRFLDSPETIAAFLAEAMKANDAQTVMHALELLQLSQIAIRAALEELFYG